ncbi:TPA: LysR family transcriptional regulator, partial [Staphylococcus aureus]|nr:LysR family transcriptional regulator [Staphylococcus aureus]
MESLELRIFKEVATVKSITKAAQNLGYVQSNVTHRIRKLETEINCELFVRSRTGVILTEEGKRLLNYANRITELLDSAMGTIKRPKKHFKVGTSETIASKKLPKLLNKVLIDEKDIDISIKIYEPKMLIDLLLNKKIDLAFINSKAITTEMLQTHFTFSE